MKKMKLLKHSLIIILLINLLSFTIIEYRTAELPEATSLSTAELKPPPKPRAKAEILSQFRNAQDFLKAFYSGGIKPDAKLGFEFLVTNALIKGQFTSNPQVLMKKFKTIKNAGGDVGNKFDDVMESLKKIEEYLNVEGVTDGKRHEVLRGLAVIMNQVTGKDKKKADVIYGLLDEINLVEKTLRTGDNSFKITIQNSIDVIELRFDKMHPDGGIGGKWDLLAKTGVNRNVYIDNKHRDFNLKDLIGKVKDMKEHVSNKANNPLYIIYNSKIEFTKGDYSDSIKKIYEALKREGIEKEQAKNFLFVGKNDIAAFPDSDLLDSIFD